MIPPKPSPELIPLSKVPQFLRDLRTDLCFLRAKDISRQHVLPDLSNFADVASHQAAVRELGRLRKFAIVRQAVIKHEIRESLGRRFCTLWLSAGPITLLFCVVVVLDWISCLLANPHIMDWFRPFFWDFTLRHRWL